MNQAEFLQYLAARLEAEGIPFMVSGSVASGYHGEPRATYDIDIIIESTLEQIERLVGELAGRCYVAESAARDAVQRRTMFNIVDLQSGIKADLIVRKERPFSVMEFQRRRSVELSGIKVNVVSVEDCILSKLEWARLGESDRQYNDALQVARVAGLAGLDLEYLHQWSRELQVSELLERLLREVA